MKNALVNSLKRTFGNLCGKRRKKVRPPSIHSPVPATPHDDVVEDDGEAILPDDRYIRVLIAEDNVISLKIMIRMLMMRSKLVIESVNNGTLALEKVTANSTPQRGKDPFSLIILDFHMPGMSGMEVIRGIRKRNIDVPILVVTAAGKPIGDKCMRAGANAVVYKPVTKAKLLEAIDELVCPVSLEETSGTSATTSTGEECATEENVTNDSKTIKQR